VDEAAWGNLFAVIAIIVIAAVLIVIIWQVFSTRRATATLVRDDAYRKLAERTTAAHEQIVQELSAASEELADLRGRVAEIERMMKEIE
jgi:hypothetical protein